ncbi:MAG TPA: hypothetical protein V6D50_20530 [Chroococcales cyanobacterium]
MKEEGVVDLGDRSSSLPFWLKVPNGNAIAQESDKIVNDARE